MECSKEFPISQNELATVKNKQLPESTSVKCMLACSYKKAGILERHIMECSKEFPISQNELATVKNKQLPESASVKCMLGCAYKKAGIMNDEGYLSVESIYAFSEKYLSHDAEKLEKAKKFADACRHVNYVDFSGKANSDCERAGLIFKCSVEKASEFDFVV